MKIKYMTIRVKKVASPLTALQRTIPERFKDEFLMIMRYTNLLYLLYRIVCSFVEGSVARAGSLICISRTTDPFKIGQIGLREHVAG